MKKMKIKNPCKTRAFVIAAGFEPATVCLEGRCSIQLSYATKIVGVAGFEPRPPAPKAGAMTGYATPREGDLIHNELYKSLGETGIRTLATVTRRQISNCSITTLAPLLF